MVLGFQEEDDARRLLEALKERFGHFGLAIHESKTRKGKFMVKRNTQAKRMTRKLKAIRQEMKARLHVPVKEQHQ